MLPPGLDAALARLIESDRRPVVLIDGGAGSGKTTLAERILRQWPVAHACSVSLDDLYPGWGGLHSGAAAVPGLITGSGYRSWDWSRNAPGPWRTLSATRPLVIEGCGAITPASRALAGLAIWVELDEPRRRHRALARDGASFAAHWDEWAAQETDHWLASHPRELADLVVRG